MTGAQANHMGIELDFIAKPFRWMEVNGMFSWGDWRWNGTAKGFMMNTEGQIMANSRGEVVTDMSTSIPLKWIMYRWAVLLRLQLLWE